MRDAKVHAAQRGETLKQMLTRLLTSEVRTAGSSSSAVRVHLPLVGAPEGPFVEMTNDDVQSALADDDVETHLR